MKAELIKQFVKKTIRRTLIFAFVMIVVGAVGQSMSPVISNEMALTQMQNDNALFVIMSTYNRIKPIFNALYSCVILWFVYTLGRDTYKFANNIKNTENEKEN
jgi:lipoprotein signal peptidase